MIWLALDADGGVTASLRPTAEGDLTDAADEAVDLQRCERIEVAHGSRLPEADGARWGQHLADYELAPLFRQFGRPVPNMSGATGKAIEDRKGCATDAGNLRKIAGRLGYTPGPIDDYPISVPSSDLSWVRVSLQWSITLASPAPGTTQMPR
ncbi:MAG: DUF4132 domain-containing protein [Rhodobacteraceae bacterium]|nr:DUF4132 domain-containing protein [Paracoccaceae bacterium]